MAESKFRNPEAFQDVCEALERLIDTSYAAAVERSGIAGGAKNQRVIDVTSDFVSYGKPENPERRTCEIVLI